MLLKIGGKIKELREKKNITQSKMAEYLGITEQAISRWENGGGYPDMELIPAISNFLNTSIDELFEADKKAERLQKIKAEIFEKYANGFVAETIELSRNALKEFPSDYQLMYYLFTSLKWDVAHDKDEIIKLGERIINDCDDYELKIQTTYEMVVVYSSFDSDKAHKTSEKLLTLQSGINLSKEKALSCIGDANEAAKNNRSMVMTLGRECCNAIQALADTSVLSSEERIAAREKAIQIMNIIFDDGDCGTDNYVLFRVYKSMAKDYMRLDDCEKALDCLEKSTDCCIKLENNTVFTRTSLLVRGTENHSWWYNLGSPATISHSFIHDFLLKDDAYTPIRETERFKAIISSLEKYEKVEKNERRN